MAEEIQSVGEGAAAGLAAARARQATVRRLRAAYKLVLLAALSALCWAVLNLILTRRAAMAAPDFLQQLDRADPLPARLPVFEPEQLTPEELAPPAAPADADITLSS